MPHFSTETDYDRLHQSTSHDDPPYNPLRSGPFALHPSINWPPSPPQSRRTSGPSLANSANFGSSNTDSAKSRLRIMLPESERRQSWMEQVRSPSSIECPTSFTTTRPTVTSGPVPAVSTTRPAVNHGPSPAVRTSPSELRATAPVFVAPSTLRNETAVEVVDDLFPVDLVRSNEFGGGARNQRSEIRSLDYIRRYSDLLQPPCSLDSIRNVPGSSFDRRGQMARCFGAIGTPRSAQSQTHVQPQAPPEPHLSQAQFLASHPAESPEHMGASPGFAQTHPSLNRYMHQARYTNSQPFQPHGPLNTNTQFGQGPSMRFAELNETTAGSAQLSHPVTYVVVEFKLYRAEVYQMRMDWGAWEPGDILTVIVEADRGFDLGQVWNMTQDYEDAKATKKELYRKHWDQLLQYSEKDCWAELPSKEGDVLFEDFYAHLLSQPHNSGGMAPKSAVSQANLAHLACLPEKQRLEAGAKRECKSKVTNRNLPMEILEVEYQMDHQKLTIYYLSPHYIDYRELQGDLFKAFKCRLWFVALNPASFHPVAPGNTRRSFELARSLQSSGFPRDGPSTQAIDPNLAYQGQGYFSSSPGYARQLERLNQEQLQHQRREEMQRQQVSQLQSAVAGPSRHDPGFMSLRSTLTTTPSPWNSDLRSRGARGF